MPATLLDKFEAQATRRPQAVAITDGATELSYAALNGAANRLAAALLAQRSRADTAVGLYAEPGAGAIVAMLGILKAGAGYVALDPRLPGPRLANIVKAAQAALIVADRSPPPELLATGAAVLDVPVTAAGTAAAGNSGLAIDAGQLCYVMFTSGSTGIPKGVAVTHRNVAHLYGGFIDRLGIGSDAVWTLSHSLAFGFSVWEIWGALSHGGRLVIVPEAERRDPARFRALLEAAAVTICSQTPTAFGQNFLEHGTRLSPALRAIVLSGEALTAADLRRWFALYPGAAPRLINTYAITETAGQVTAREYCAGDAEHAAGLVGRPLPGVRLRVANDQGIAVPPGEAGELYVGGPGVARGYLNDRELTAQRFVDCADDGQVPGRFYRTGDLARLRDSGELEFLGRADHQVKIRGHRVELGEIEKTLGEHPGIRQAIVAMQESSARQRLVAYYVAARSIASAGSEPEFWPSLGSHQLYDEFLYDLMSAEHARLEFYRQELAAAVRDRAVLDIGSGPHALLARICVEVGAKKVYAVEALAEVSAQAQRLIEQLGLAGRIEIVTGDIATIDLPEPVDVCTQGIIGNIGSADGIVAAWNAARRFFAPGCVAVPAQCQTLFAPVELPAALRARPVFGRGARSYVERLFETVGRRFDLRLCVRNVGPEALLATPEIFEALDFTSALELGDERSTRFEVTRPGQVDGFMAWIRLGAGSGPQLDYLATQRAWLPVFLPASEGPLAVGAGQTLDVRWTSRARDGVLPDYRIEARLDARPASSLHCASEHLADECGATPLHRALFASTERPDLSAADLRRWLAGRLPDYMLPAEWIELERLPVNGNGKLDRSMLPAARRGSGSSASSQAPLEQDLAHLWAEILEINAPSAEDNFFDLGGDSISAVRLTSALQRLLDDSVALVAIFDAPTIGELAAYLLVQHRDAVGLRYGTGGVAAQRVASPAEAGQA